MIRADRLLLLTSTSPVALDPPEAVRDQFLDSLIYGTPIAGVYEYRGTPLVLDAGHQIAPGMTLFPLSSPIYAEHYVCPGRRIGRTWVEKMLREKASVKAGNPA